jgi:hypothetical protein
VSAPGERKTASKSAKKKQTGRPSDFTQKTADAICTRLAAGESLRAICLSDGMPDKSTVFRWLAINEPFRDQYARAREAQADFYAEEIIEISDDGTNDWMERRSEAEKGAGIESGWVLNGEHVQRSRLRVDARKWFASKVAPKKYGDKIEATLQGGDKAVKLEIGWAKAESEGTSDPSRG